MSEERIPTTAEAIEMVNEISKSLAEQRQTNADLLAALQDAENTLRGVAYEHSQCIVADRQIDTLYRTADRVHTAIDKATP